MKGLRIRALVLAAGRGERLRPLTDTTPKPLLPVLGTSILRRTLDELVRLPVEGVAINLHHLGAQIRQQVGPRDSGLPITYSEERDRLGTSGALLPLSEFLRAADLVVVINGDTFCRWPLKRLVKVHLRRRAAATLLVTSRAEPARFGGGLALERGGRVLGFGAGEGPDAARRKVFAGAHVFSPELLVRLPEGPSDFIHDLYRPMLAAGEHLTAVTTRRPWHDLGTPARYLEGVLDRLRPAWLPAWLSRRSWRHPKAAVAPQAHLRRAVLEAGSHIHPEARIEETLVLSGAKVGPGCELEHSIVGPEVVLNPGTVVHGQLITARGAIPPPPGSSALGRLVFTPLVAGGG